MKIIYSHAFLMLLGLWIIASCTKAELPKEPDPNAGKHRLSSADVRSWEEYPILLLVATKHHVGVDTVAQLVTAFSSEFNRNGLNIVLPAELNRGVDQIPSAYNLYEEDTPSVEEDATFFVKQGNKYNLFPSAAANIITDFYSLVSDKESDL